MKMELVDIARVDLGPNHNGRVARRNVYEKPDGTRVIVDKGRHIPLMQIHPKPGKRGIGYVTKGGVSHE